MWVGFHSRPVAKRPTRIVSSDHIHFFVALSSHNPPMLHREREMDRDDSSCNVVMVGESV